MADEKTVLIRASSDGKSYASIPSADDSAGYSTFLPVDGDTDGELFYVHEMTQWDLHFRQPLFQSMLFMNDPCDGRDYGANERNYLAWMRLAAGFASTAFAFILNYYTPPGRSIFGPDKPASADLANRGGLAWGLIFILCALGTILYAYFGYVESTLMFAKRRLIVQFNWQTLVFFGLTCAAMIGACAYMMTADLLSREAWQFYYAM
ncbi:hypothetical protein V1511DRAFT_525446 [Dipodascopsis uninucleata]